MASAKRASEPSEPQDEPPDEAWVRLTEGMAPYERFRYIARHVLEAALDDARGYADDERLFAVDGEDPETAREHLRGLEQELEADDELTELERRFLCEAVAEALRERGLEARCYDALLGGEPGCGPADEG